MIEATDRTRSYLPDQVINNYLNVHEWQALETKKAVNQLAAFILNGLRDLEIRWLKLAIQDLGQVE